MKKLYRSRRNRMLVGICGGVAEYFGVDPTVVRVAWAVGSLFIHLLIAAYIICAVVIPERPENDSIVDAE